MCCLLFFFSEVCKYGVTQARQQVNFIQNWLNKHYAKYSNKKKKRENKMYFSGKNFDHEVGVHDISIFSFIVILWTTLKIYIRSSSKNKILNFQQALSKQLTVSESSHHLYMRVCVLFFYLRIICIYGFDNPTEYLRVMYLYYAHECIHK